MSKGNFVKLFIALFLIAGTGIVCTRMPKVEFTERDLELSLEHDGYTRNFIVHLPEHHERLQNIPLLVAVHGGGGTARDMVGLTKGRFNELADECGFMVVYPQGLGKSWNDGRDDPISYAHENNIDDIGFFSKLISKMIEDYKADPGQVCVTGISNGGFMSVLVSRDLADQVKAIVPVCAAIPLDSKDAHLSAPPMNVLIINGTQDPLVPYNGGAVEVLGKERGMILSTDETISIFLTRNGCSDLPELEELADKDPQDGTRVIRQRYTNTGGAKEVVLLKIVGGGHTWPGGWQYLREKWIGKTSKDINACDEIWSFFRSLK